MAQDRFESEYGDKPKPIYARSGWEIPQPSRHNIDKERQPIELVSIRTQALVDAMLRNNKRGLQIRSVSAYKYNCVGMVFANRRAWIEIGHIYDILREDGYYQITPQELSVGDLVVYSLNNSPKHVGLITYVHPSLGQIVNARVLSKWGHLGEVEHQLYDVPAFCGSPTSYWSERVI